MSKHFPGIAEAARKQFEVNLAAFLKSRPEWSRSTLLRAAGMDMSLIARVEAGKGFSVTALDRLQETMEAIISGAIREPPPKPKPKTKKAKEIA